MELNKDHEYLISFDMNNGLHYCKTVDFEAAKNYEAIVRDMLSQDLIKCDGKAIIIANKVVATQLIDTTAKREYLSEMLRK